MVKSSGIGENEPWELEDSHEEKAVPVPRINSFSAAFNDDEQFTNEKRAEAPLNFFADAFNPPALDIQQTQKSTHIEEDEQDDDDDDDVTFPSAKTAEPALVSRQVSDTRQPSIDVIVTQPDDDLDPSKSSSTSNSDEVEIKPTFTEVAPVVSSTSLPRNDLTREGFSRLNDRSKH